MPPVFDLTASTASAIEEDEVISSVRRVMLGSCSRSDILDRLRAVAKTWTPRRANSFARPWPMPPVLQPVMRTVLGAITTWKWDPNGARRAGNEDSNDTRRHSGLKLEAPVPTMSKYQEPSYVAKRPLEMNRAHNHRLHIPGMKT